MSSNPEITTTSSSTSPSQSPTPPPPAIGPHQRSSSLSTSISAISRKPSFSRRPSHVNLRSTATTSTTTTAIASSASSISTVEGIQPASGVAMIADSSENDLDVEGEVRAVDGDTTEALRKSLKNLSLSRNMSEPVLDVAGSHKKTLSNDGKRPLTLSITIDDIPDPGGLTTFPPRQYFILTHAGKPVFASRPESESGPSQDDITSAMGIMQAIISVYADDGDKIRCINAGRTKISFLLRSPLYYVCVSSWGEPESVIRHHLEYLHLQILSVITLSHLSSIFQKRTNFDLRRLLDGTEGFLHSLIRRMEGIGFTDDAKTSNTRRRRMVGDSGGFGMGMMMAALEAVRIDPVVRTKVGEVLVPSKDMKDTLYVLLVAGTRVLTLLRPKKHSVHPADLHLLINTISSSSLSSTPASSSWLPICLPKFNPNGFLHAYVSFLNEDRSNVTAPSNPGRDAETTPRPSVEPGLLVEPMTSVETDNEQPQPSNSTLDTGNVSHVDSSPADSSPVKERDTALALAVVTAEREGFERLRTWAGAVIESLESSGLLRSVFTATRQHEYTTSELGIPGLRHFVYKSRKHVQLTMPIWEEPYNGLGDQRRLITLYQILHDAVHARSGQPGGPLKLQYIRTEKESVMCWVTTPFELYVALSPLLPKSAAVSAANSLTRWVKKEEDRLFLRDAPVF